MPEHPNDHLLLMYALDPSLAGGIGELETHLTGCAECRKRLDTIRQADDLMHVGGHRLEA